MFATFDCYALKGICVILTTYTEVTPYPNTQMGITGIYMSCKLYSRGICSICTYSFTFYSNMGMV